MSLKDHAYYVAIEKGLITQRYTCITHRILKHIINVIIIIQIIQLPQNHVREHN